jgi:hypothetical protein
MMSLKIERLENVMAKINSFINRCRFRYSLNAVNNPAQISHIMARQRSVLEFSSVLLPKVNPVSSNQFPMPPADTGSTFAQVVMNFCGHKDGLIFAGSWRLKCIIDYAIFFVFLEGKRKSIMSSKPLAPVKGASDVGR